MKRYYFIHVLLLMLVALPCGQAFSQDIPKDTVQALTPEEQAEMDELVSRARRGITNSALKIADNMKEKGHYQEAKHWYHYAFIQDSGRAGFALYHMYKQGFITLEHPETIRKLSVHMMERAAYKGDDSSALELGLTYLKGEYATVDYDKALLFLELARRQGKAIASYHLGNIYSNGLFASIQPRKALSYYKEASEKGISEATRYLGLAYLTGAYYDRDVSQATLLFEKSIAQGNIEAMRDLANLYRYEVHDMSQYAHWMQKAADAGNSDAQYYMGLQLESQNPAKAKEYFVAAANQSHLMARQKLPDIKKKAAEEGDSYDAF